jgi:hypothetical protein
MPCWHGFRTQCFILKTEGSNHGREKMVKKMMIKSQKSNEQNDLSLLENTKIILL